MAGKINFAPPTPEQLQKFEKHLKRSLFVEHAATLAGIPVKVLGQWIAKGRAGHRDFVEFVDLIDRENAKQAGDLIDMVTIAVKDGDLKAAQWLYKQKFDQREKAVTKKWMDLEEAIEAESSGVEAPEEDVAAAEARMLELEESEVH